MKYRVWHIPNVPGNAFHQEVRSLEEAKLLLMTLARYDLYLGDDLVDNNAQGLEECSDSGGDWTEWHSDEDEYRDIAEVTRADPMEPVHPRRWQ